MFDNVFLKFSMASLVSKRSYTQFSQFFRHIIFYFFFSDFGRRFCCYILISFYVRVKYSHIKKCKLTSCKKPITDISTRASSSLFAVGSSTTFPVMCCSCSSNVISEKPSFSSTVTIYFALLCRRVIKLPQLQSSKCYKSTLLPHG